MKTINLSVVIVARNEEGKLPDCINSAKWADEIIVIDNDSNDATSYIAEKLGAKVYKAEKHYILKYSDLRNFGLKNSLGKWIFYIDADERISPKLKEEIKVIIRDYSTKNNAYAIPRKNIILGSELKHGWWPDYVKRLFRKSSLKGWKGDLHEEPLFDGELGHLKNPLIHIKHDNLSDMVEKTNLWSDVEAKLMFNAGHPPMNILRFCSAIKREFFLRIVKEKAYLDGSVGIIYALYQVYSKFISYAKLWELQVISNNRNSK